MVNNRRFRLLPARRYIPLVFINISTAAMEQAESGTLPTTIMTRKDMVNNVEWQEACRYVYDREVGLAPFAAAPEVCTAGAKNQS